MHSCCAGEMPLLNKHGVVLIILLALDNLKVLINSFLKREYSSLQFVNVISWVVCVSLFHENGPFVDFSGAICRREKTSMVTFHVMTFTVGNWKHKGK